jgi:mono/diheme cytochrome c family protein
MLTAALLVLIATPFASAQQTSTASGVFTAEQAKIGERAYQSTCATCHGGDLHSTEPEAPDLTDGAFKFAWQGKTVASRFETIRGTMPLGQPGSLADQTYIDIIAYILQFNGMPAGSGKLVPDPAVLEKIVIASP